jgi:hypothetical protein
MFNFILFVLFIAVVFITVYRYKYPHFIDHGKGFVPVEITENYQNFELYDDMSDYDPDKKL